MNTYAAALSQHPLATHAVGETAGTIMEQFAGDDPDLVIAFFSPHHGGMAEEIGGALRQLLEPRVLLGMSAVSIVGGGREVENEPALSVFAARFPDASIAPVTLSMAPTPDGPTIVGWPDLTDEPQTLLLLADPFSFPVDEFLVRCAEDAPQLQVIGGLASAAAGPGGNRLIIDEEVGTDGAVGVLLPEGVAVSTVVSQGCRPIGQPLVITRADRNFIHELAGVPALERLQEVFTELPEEDRELVRHGLHLGLVVDEHRAEFGRGDFLVRNVLGADQESGTVAVGDLVRVGQTAQFHVRDASSADDDLRVLLSGVEAGAGLMFTCNGRGQHLFGVPDHDAGLVEALLGPIPLAGCFCAGEIGPVGQRSFLHGFTASLALFRT